MWEPAILRLKNSFHLQCRISQRENHVQIWKHRRKCEKYLWFHQEWLSCQSSDGFDVSIGVHILKLGEERGSAVGIMPFLNLRHFFCPKIILEHWWDVSVLENNAKPNFTYCHVSGVCVTNKTGFGFNDQIYWITRVHKSLTGCHVLPTGHSTGTVLISNWTANYCWLFVIYPRIGPHHRKHPFPSNECPIVERVTSEMCSSGNMRHSIKRKSQRSKFRKEWITVLLSGNAERDYYFTNSCGRTENPRDFQGILKPLLPVLRRSRQKGYITSHVILQYLSSSLMQL
jgi:hypothetical protein